ncbi:hypothetical protein [Myroides sp. WP-1]|uniref:hypothetical protein n=1 Tax=Myroides sp. WP-1 TaxID=2759944 RepID=UPI0015F8C0C4|nr:hypothetical protein [Myroides sp. WP-1]MBB1138913.1 hypothetical protein [Myroides sp. WP-1]
MKFIFLMIVTLIQFAFQFVTLLSVNPTYSEETSVQLEKEENSNISKGIKIYKKQNEK